MVILQQDTRIKKRNSADWQFFVKRGPVNFLSPRARQCRVNKLIISWVTLDEAKGLLEARNKPKDFWYTLTERISKRLKSQNIIN